MTEYKKRMWAPFFQLLDSWYKTEILILSLIEQDNLLRWMEASIEGRYFWDRANVYQSDRIFFEKEEDLILFKLTWG